MFSLLLPLFEDPGERTSMVLFIRLLVLHGSQQDHVGCSCTRTVFRQSRLGHVGSDSTIHHCIDSDDRHDDGTNKPPPHTFPAPLSECPNDRKLHPHPRDTLVSRTARLRFFRWKKPWGHRRLQPRDTSSHTMISITLCAKIERAAHRHPLRRQVIYDPQVRSRRQPI